MQGEIRRGWHFEYGPVSDIHFYYLPINTQINHVIFTNVVLNGGRNMNQLLRNAYSQITCSDQVLREILICYDYASSGWQARYI